MAKIDLKELFEIIKEHPQYHEKWKLGVPPEEAFWLTFAKKEESVILSPVEYEIPGGYRLMIDLGNDGKVYGMEIT